MSSWFTVPDSFKDLTDKVQQALPKIDHDMIEKLTLTTPELTAERQRIDQEERRKEEIKDMLAGMFPWETRDPERDILVDECKEAILLLSENKETFFGPYHMPGKKVKLKEDKNADDDDDGNENTLGGGADTDDDDDGDLKPPSESLEKLSKLEPLPVLLRDFDLNAHVGLINRLLKEDPKLVKMQSTLSGGGEREHIFWKNYFFHCAYTRYEAGLSIDEIWSDQPPEHITVTTTTSAATSTNDGTAENMTEEETITFDTTKEAAAAAPEKAFPGDPTTDADAPFGSSSSSNNPKETTTTTKDASSITPSAGGLSEGASEYDMVADATGDAAVAGGDDSLNAVDYELDELEAEIARELED